MNRRLAAWIALIFILTPQLLLGDSPLNSTLLKYVEARCQEFDQIPAERKELLAKLATYVRQESEAGRAVELNFICTHNSRRSHLSQLWAHAAANHFNVEKVNTYSGGTDATAFNPRAIAALQRAGFSIVVDEEVLKQSDKNPIYIVNIGEHTKPLKSFSKHYASPPNPTTDFCAILVCSQADTSCPTVTGCKLRLAISYDDPKVSDGTESETKVYDERCAQIAREMLYAFSRVKK